MTTLKGSEENLVDLLNSLIELDYDAIEAYRAAIARIEDTNDRSVLAAFLQDHERHVTDLSSIVRRHGEKPAPHGDVKQVLTKGKVVLAGLVGDRIVLAAMKTNEDDTVAAYERACRHAWLPDETRVVLEKNLDDERRHRAWIEKRFAATEGTKLRKAG